MNYYFVDYENVQVQGLSGVDKMTEGDVVCVFYSENANTLTFAMHRKLNDSKANIMFQKVAVGQKNALDFQLSSFLGYVIRDNMMEPYQYYIVSNDHGYDALATYWKRSKVDVQRVANLTGKPVEVEKEAEKEAEKDDLEKKLEALLKDKNAISFVAKAIKHYKTKQGINNALLKQYKNGKKASEIYSAIKPLIADKKGK